MDKTVIYKQENLLANPKKRALVNTKPLNYLSSKKIFLDDESRVIFIIVLFSQLLLPNGYYLFASLLTIYIIFYNLQQPLKSGVFTVIALNHFAQIIAAVWQANSVNKDINFRSHSMSDATIASLFGLVCMFLPIIYFQNKLPVISLERLRKDANKFSTDKTFNCYLVAFLTTSTLSSVAFVFGGLTQVIFSLVKLKWLLFLLFGYQSLLKNEKRSIFYLFVALEFVSGFYSFFSEFKTVIYFTVVLLLGLLQVINIKKLSGEFLMRWKNALARPKRPRTFFTCQTMVWPFPTLSSVS